MVVIANLYGGGDIHNAEAREEYREIKMNVLLQCQEGERTYVEMFRKYRTRVFIAMSAQALAQLNGINVISYYAPYVFESAGWVGHDAVLTTGLNGIIYFLSTIPPWYLVDRWGRRAILLTGAVAMAVSLSLISYFIFLDVRWTPRLVVLFVMIYNAAFGYSWGPIPWLYPPEILPLSIRSKGASLSTATNWAANWLVGEMTPILQEWIKWRLYLVHAFFCGLSFVIGKFCGLVLRREAAVTDVATSVLYLSGDLRSPPRGHGLFVWRRQHGCGHPVDTCRDGISHQGRIAGWVWTRHPGVDERHTRAVPRTKLGSRRRQQVVDGAGRRRGPKRWRVAFSSRSRSCRQQRQRARAICTAGAARGWRPQQPQLMIGIGRIEFLHIPRWRHGAPAVSVLDWAMAQCRRRELGQDKSSRAEK